MDPPSNCDTEREERAFSPPRRRSWGMTKCSYKLVAIAHTQPRMLGAQTKSGADLEMTLVRGRAVATAATAIADV